MHNNVYESWWLKIAGSKLAQGDLLENCILPIFAGFNDPDQTYEEEIQTADLIVITQSCDLENKKARFVTLCPIYKISAYETLDESLKQKNAWENVRKGRVEGLYLLSSIEDANNPRDAYVVEFGQIVSLPIDYLETHAANFASRYRLKSPYLEHFSQAFARFFMRVGLPSHIPPFK